MTAIAAAIACSTPSFAQSADPPAAETTAPVVAAPVTAEPIVADTPIAADTPAPVKTVAKPAARKATTAKAPVARSRPTPARVASAAPVAAAPAPAAPVAEAPAVEPLPVQPEAAPVAAPAATEDANSLEAMLPIAGLAGVALLALAGVFLALRRRRRNAAEANEDAALRDAQLAAIGDAEPEVMVEPEPQPDPVTPAFIAAPVLATKTAPVVAAAPVADPTPDVDGPVTELPEDFDLSRFGYNVQEAYKGPTEDNPSLSLKNRLTRARGMDQLERNMDAEVEAATGEPALTEDELTPPAEAPAAEPAVDPARGDLSPSTPYQKPVMHPAYPK